MKKTVKLLEKLLALANGVSLPDSRLKGEWFRQMQDDGILTAITHGSRKSWRAADGQSLRNYLAGEHDLSNLEECMAILQHEEPSRAELVDSTGDSKFIAKRTFTGFMVNSYDEIEASVNNTGLIIRPVEGSFTFIYDYKTFVIPPEVIVVGIENAENFRHVALQRSFFEKNVSPTAPLLFVSRYPQNGDLIRWLLSVNNRYVHFGDLDLAGVHIYLSEFRQRLGIRASFLIPDDYEARLSRGSQERYNDQYIKFRDMKITDPAVQPLVDSINRLHRGYDQEGFILQK